MSASQLTPQAEGRWLLQGDIDFSSAPALLEAGCRLIEQAHPRCQFDLSAVESLNTAALSLLLSWRRHADQASTELEFFNLPESLRAIAQLSDLESML